MGQDTLAGRAGRCPGRPPGKTYPACPLGQHCPLRQRHSRREHQSKFMQPACLGNLACFSHDTLARTRAKASGSVLARAMLPALVETLSPGTGGHVRKRGVRKNPNCQQMPGANTSRNSRLKVTQVKHGSTRPTHLVNSGSFRGNTRPLPGKHQPKYASCQQQNPARANTS